MSRIELISSVAYCETTIQLDISQILNKYLIGNNISIKQLSNETGYKKSFIRQAVQGDFEGSIYDLIVLMKAVGYVPIIKFFDLTELIENDSNIHSP